MATWLTKQEIATKAVYHCKHNPALRTSLPCLERKHDQLYRNTTLFIIDLYFESKAVGSKYPSEPRVGWSPNQTKSSGFVLNPYTCSFEVVGGPFIQL